MRDYLDTVARTLHVPGRRSARAVKARRRGRRTTFVPVRDDALARGIR